MLPALAGLSLILLLQTEQWRPITPSAFDDAFVTVRPSKVPLGAPAQGAKVISTPSPGDMDHFTPRGGLPFGVSGSAVVACNVKATGALVDCRVTSETPDYANFGYAALQLAKRTKVSPRNDDGESLAGKSVSLPYVWPRR